MADDAVGLKVVFICELEQGFSGTRPDIMKETIFYWVGFGLKTSPPGFWVRKGNSGKKDPSTYLSPCKYIRICRGY